ncbi:MAG: hypothetical protein WAK95_15700 [Desulfobacterales bacterium]
MSTSETRKAARCCSMEKQQLTEEIRQCDFCSDTYDELHDCYRSAARDSGLRARCCLAD